MSSSLSAPASAGGGLDGVDYDAIIVGAGFAGLLMLHDLRERGVSARVLEAAPEVGGTWYWNAYPGARTDSESWVYAYSFSEELMQEWEWTERFTRQPESLAYLKHVAGRFDLRKDIQLNTKVESAAFDEATGTWAVTTDSGERLVSQYLITAVGPLSEPYGRTSPAWRTSQASGCRPRAGRRKGSTSPASGWRSSAPGPPPCSSSRSPRSPQPS